MKKMTDTSDGRCRETTCGCEDTGRERCACGEACACKDTCTCGKACACAAKT